MSKHPIHYRKLVQNFQITIYERASGKYDFSIDDLDVACIISDFNKPQKTIEASLKLALESILANWDEAVDYLGVGFNE